MQLFEKIAFLNTTLELLTYCNLTETQSHLTVPSEIIMEVIPKLPIKIPENNLKALFVGMIAQNPGAAPLCYDRPFGRMGEIIIN